MMKASELFEEAVQKGLVIHSFIRSSIHPAWFSEPLLNFFSGQGLSAGCCGQCRHPVWTLGLLRPSSQQAHCQARRSMCQALLKPSLTSAIEVVVVLAPLKKHPGPSLYQQSHLPGEGCPLSRNWGSLCAHPPSPQGVRAQLTGTSGRVGCPLNSRLSSSGRFSSLAFPHAHLNL